MFNYNFMIFDYFYFSEDKTEVIIKKKNCTLSLHIPSELAKILHPHTIHIYQTSITIKHISLRNA
jgi:hypothetical protein